MLRAGKHGFLSAQKVSSTLFIGALVFYRFLTCTDVADGIFWPTGSAQCRNFFSRGLSERRVLLTVFWRTDFINGILSACRMCSRGFFSSFAKGACLSAQEYACTGFLHGVLLFSVCYLRKDFVHSGLQHAEPVSKNSNITCIKLQNAVTRAGVPHLLIDAFLSVKGL